MPIYKVEAPDGKLLKIEGPEGASEQEILAIAAQLYQPEDIKPDTGFTGAFAAGKERLKGDIALLAGKTGLMSLEDAERYKREKDILAQQMFKPTEEGWSESPFLKFRETLGGSLPYMAAPLAAGVGAKVFALPAAVGLTGAGLASLSQFTGSNLARQIETGKTLEESSLGKAAAAAVPQTALDVISLRMIPSIGKLFGAAGKEVTPELAKEIAKQGMLRTTAAYGMGSAKLAGIEGATEVGQQFLERLQAGLNISDQQARDEYFDSFIGGAVLGGTLAVPGTYLERGATIRKGAEMEAEQKRQEIVERQKAQQEAALAERKRIQETQQKLGVPETLALPKPEDRYVEPEVADPLLNPLGNFKTTDLSAKEIREINQRRQAMGKPRIGRTFSIEDLADVFTPEETKTAEGVLGRLVASRTGFQAGDDISPSTLNLAAQQRGIATDTQGFRDFLERTTGTNNLEDMSPPQRLAVKQALDNIPVGSESQVLQAGITTVKHYTPDQYNETLSKINKEFAEVGNKPNGRESVLKQIEKYSGLTREKDQQRLLDEAVRNGDLERNIEVRTVGGVEKNVETFKPPTALKPLPAGMDIRKETFKQADVPEAFEIRAGSNVINQKATQEEAEAELAIHERNRQAEIVRLEKEIAKLQAGIQRREAELLNARSLGQDDTNEFFIKSANYYGQDQVANQEINNLRQEQQKFSQPIQIVPVGTKALTRDAFTFYEKDQPLVRFETEEQAEAYGISRLNDQTLKQIIESAPAQKQTGRVKRYVDLAQKELEARAGKAEGIKITTKKGKEGATERLKELGIYTKEARDKLDDFKKTLLPTLKRFGLEKIGLRIVNSIEDGKADGYYVQNLITLALDAKDIMGTLRHESIHAIKELGGFTDAEWKVLTNKAKAEWVQRFITDRGLFKRYQDQYKQDYGSLKGFDEYIQEEAIAEAFRFYSKNKLPAGMIGNIIYRIQKFFEALRNSLNKLGFTTANDIFAKVEEGGIKTLETIKAEAKPARLSFKSEKKEITPLDVQQARIYERELEGLIKKIGDRIVGMKSEETLADVKKAVKKLQSYTAQGLKGKDWYERSAKAVLDAFNNDAVLAEKFFQVIAITSANTEVAANFTKAANAWTQFAEGRPIKAGTENENKKIDALLNFGEEWEGRKTNTFYSNLMEAMDGKDSGRSTIDLHMTRMIFGKDVPTDAQYELAENMVRLLASKLDVAPRQIQAASWVTQKAKTMFDDYRAKGWKKDLSDEELSQFAFERAVADYSHQMKKRVSELPITEALKEPSKEIKTRVQTITGEVIPSVKSEMAEAEELAFNYKEKLTKEIANSDAVQRIAKFLGVDSKIRITVGSGAYASKVNPNLIVQIINDDAQAAEKDALDIANAMSYVFKQDATPFYRADPKLLDTEQIGFKIKFDTANLTPAQQKKILGIFQNKFGADAGFTKVRNNELVIINYRGEDGKPFLVPDEEFMQGLADIRDAISKVSPIESQEMFGAKSEYPYHDWQEEPSGVGIVSGIQDRRPQRPDIQRGLDDIRESFVGSVRETIRKSGKEPKFSLRAEGVDQRFSLALGNIEPTTFLVSEKNPNNTGNLAFMPGSAPFAKYPIRLPVGTHDDISDKGYGANHILRRMQTDVKRRPAEVTKERLEDLILHIEDLGKRFKRVYRSGPQLVLYDPLTDDAMFVKQLADHYEVQSMYSDARIPTKYGNPAWSGKNVQPPEAKKFEEKQRGILVQASKEGRVEPKPIGVKVKRVLTPNQIEAEAERKPIKGTLSIKKRSLRAPDTKEFKQWFKDSKVVDEDGNPKVMYHGTRQEIFEPRTRGNRNAFFVSPDANFANKYAVNDLDWFPEKPFRTIEEGAQVYPVYISAKNPFDYENPKHLLKIIPQFRKVLKEEENYNRSQIEELVNEFRDGSWKAIEWANDYDLFKKNGFDAFYTLEQGRKNLGVFEPTQIKSAIGNNGTYSATSPDIRYSLKAPDTPEVDAFMNRKEGKSKIVNEDGTPKIMYHGTARDITEFMPKQANAIFFTDNPKFAEDFTYMSEDYMNRELFNDLTDNEKEQIQLQALENAKDGLTNADYKKIKEEISSFPWAENLKEFGYKTINNDILFAVNKLLGERLPSRRNIVPVYIYARNPFDYQNEENLDKLYKKLNEYGNNSRGKPFGEMYFDEGLEYGNWQVIEDDRVQAAIKELGFDAFYVREGGNKNLAVYDSSQIKSAFNVAPTAESKDIRYSLRPPETPEFKRFFKGSKIVNEDGSPKVMYHGTAEDFNEFIISKKANRTSMPDGFYFTSSAEEASDYAEGAEGANVIAAYLSIKNPFDLKGKNKITNEMVMQFRDELRKENPDLPFDWIQSKVAIFKENTNAGRFPFPNITFSTDAMTRVFKVGGYDGLLDGDRHVVAFDSSQIKSVFNQKPTKESKDIRYSFNAPPETHTKLEQANTYGKAITDTITSVYKMFKDPEERIKTRIAFIDPNSGLARSLKDQELYSDGVLRADLLARAKAQTINLIRNGLQTGIPVVNSDGSVIIEIDEVNNLANSRIIADRLDENYYVKGSGLSGRAFVAEVARALRGKEIMAEDKIHNAKTGEKRNREKQVTQAQIDWAEQQLKNVPELQEIFDIWKKVNTGLINLWESVGLFSKAEADTYRAKKFYVSLAASNTDLETMMESQLGFTAAGLKSTPKVQKLEGAEFLRDKNGKVVLDEEGKPIPLQRNIWENIDKQYASMLAGAYQNQVRKVAVGQLVDAEAAKVVKPNTVGVNLKYKDPTNPLADSKGVVHAIVDNATDLAAFESMHYELGPVLKFFGGATNILRAGALLNPMFWIRQLIRDPIHASIVANSGIVTPFHSAKEYINVLRKDSEEAKILASRGVIGQYDSTLDLYTFLEQVGTEKVNQGNLQKAFHKLMQMHEASDAATRVAIFKKEKQAALERGMTDEQATNFAVMKSREAINFLVHGNSKILNAARQMIPFLSASITSLDTVYRAATGYNLPASEREAARKLFKQRAALMFGASVAYAMLMQDDEEYQKQPNYVKDNNWLIKNPIGDGFLKVPVPYEVGFLFKVVPEVALRYAYGNDTGKEMIKAYKDGLLHNLPTGGVPVPQAIKPAFETITNYSFFTGNPVESIGESRLPVEMRGRNASETAKFLSGAGLGFVGLSPSKIDNLVQGYFAEAGTFMFTLADELVYALNGKQGAARNLEKQPFFKAFMTDPNADKAVSNFFDIQQTANRTAQGFNELKNSGRLDEAREFVEDEEKRMLIASAPALRKVGETMTKIRRQIEIVKADESRTPEERRELINKLTAQYNIVARQGVRAADTLGIR